MSTIAEILKDGGYATHMTGKWHAGHFSVHEIPTSRGFDSSIGYFNGKEHHFSHFNTEDGCQGNVTDLWDTWKPADRSYDGIFGDYIYTSRVLDIVEKKQGPLFVYWAMQCAHDPLEAPQRFVAAYEDTPAPVEYALVGVVDESLKNFTTLLKDRSLWVNSLIVVHADNGGPAFSDQQAASNYPLRGGKYTLFDGGIRTNAFITGGFLPSDLMGYRYLPPVHICDWYATFARLAGVSVPDPHPDVPPPDAIDLWDSLVMNTSSHDDRVLFVASGAIVVDDYKLIATDPGHAQWTGPLYPQTPATGPAQLPCSPAKPCLFDVVTDPSETTDLASSHPDLLAQLNDTLSLLMTSVFHGTFNTSVTQADVCAATLQSGGILTPGDYYDVVSIPTTRSSSSERH